MPVEIFWRVACCWFFGNCTNTYDGGAVCPTEVSVSFIAKTNREYASASLRERIGE